LVWTTGGHSWAHLVVIDREGAGAAFSDNLVRGILAVRFTIAEQALSDTLTRFASELIGLAATYLIVVELVVLEAAGRGQLIRVIFALGFTITKLSFGDT